MIDHIGFTVSNIAAAKDMYQKALLPLGYSVGMEGYGYIGFGKDGKLGLWIGEKNDRHATIPTDIHVCFSAPNKDAVDEFYRAGLDVGFKDNGAPGIREMYASNYYAAFLIDSDGNNLEAVSYL